MCSSNPASFQLESVTMSSTVVNTLPIGKWTYPECVLSSSLMELLLYLLMESLGKLKSIEQQTWDEKIHKNIGEKMHFNL